MNILTFYCFLLLAPILQTDSDEVISITTEAVSEEATHEPETSSKVILYGMTAVGVALIGVSLSRSKFFRKK